MATPGQQPGQGETAVRSSRRKNRLAGAAWGIAGVAVFALAAIGLVLFMQWFSDPEGHIRVVDPVDRAVVEQSEFMIRGTSEPEWAGVYRVLDEGRRQQVFVAENGDWFYPATLTEGENVFEFHLGSHYGQSARVTIFYQPK